MGRFQTRQHHYLCPVKIGKLPICWFIHHQVMDVDRLTTNRSGINHQYLEENIFTNLVIWFARQDYHQRLLLLL